MPRKTLKPRAYAIAHGHVMYEGKACPRCYSRRRYVTNGSCMHCTNERDNGMRLRRSRLGIDPDSAIARLAARAAGESFYHGHECGRCGHGLRYVSNAECIRCNRARKRDYAAEWQARKPAPAPYHGAPLSTPLARLYAGILAPSGHAKESP